jgi:hypothetical protein
MIFVDSCVYEGQCVGGQMVDGKMTYGDDSTCGGCWVDGMRHGHGRCIYIDESIYQGEFKEVERHG